ncbi:protein kinase [bacterium]|jgi:serine/threonine protein kinase|nr:protein kinase [bacterium]
MTSDSDHLRGGSAEPLKALYSELYKDLPYRLERCLGSDANSTLFQGVHKQTQIPLRIQIIELPKKSAGFKSAELERILDSLKKIRNPNILCLLDYSISGGHLALAFEPFVAIPLQRYVQDPSNDVALAFHACFQVLSGLEELHELGLIHHDLSPENILLNSSGVVKLSVVPPIITSLKSTKEAALGTPGYTAPECWDESTPIDRRSDVFSFGSLLYFCVTGGLHPPRVLPASKIPEKYREIVLCARASTPDARYQNLRELEFALLALTGHEESLAIPNERVFTLSELNDAQKEALIEGAEDSLVTDGNVASMVKSGLKPYWELPIKFLSEIWDSFMEQFTEIVSDTKSDIFYEAKEIVDRKKQAVKKKSEDRRERKKRKKEARLQRKLDRKREKDEARRSKDHALWAKQREEAQKQLQQEMIKAAQAGKPGSERVQILKVPTGNSLLGPVVIGVCVLGIGIYAFTEWSTAPAEPEFSSALPGAGQNFQLVQSSGKIFFREGPLDSWKESDGSGFSIPSQVRTGSDSKTTLKDPSGKLKLNILWDSELTLSSFESNPQGFEKVLELTLDTGTFEFDSSRSRILLRLGQTFGEITTRSSAFQVFVTDEEFKILVQKGALRAKLDKGRTLTLSPGETLIMKNGKLHFHGRK